MPTSHALIIEDEEKLAKIFTTVLEMADFQIEVATDGATALARLKETVPDVVILDLHLPHVSGREVLEMIRSDKRLVDTRVIMVTADVEQGLNLQNEADFVLFKPVSTVQLREVATRLRTKRPKK